MIIEHVEDIASEFLARVAEAVYCNMATVDTQGRPRSRILHPIWEWQPQEGLIGWAISYPASLKARHLQANAHVSLAYIHEPQRPTYADCTAAWIQDSAQKSHVWELYKNTAPPLGFDPAPFYSSIDDQYFGILQFMPWRVELAELHGTKKIWKKI